MWTLSISLVLASIPGPTKDPVPKGHENVKLAEQRVALHTEAGIIVLALYPEVAPKHVAHIQKLVEVGGFTSNYFYRSESWLLQMAEVLSREKRFKDLTISAQDFDKLASTKLPAEFSKLPHMRGVISMGRLDEDINSGRSAFSIIIEDSPHLDKIGYTVFGRVEYGMDVVEELRKVPTIPGSRTPIKTLKILLAELVAGSDVEKQPPFAANPVPIDPSLFQRFNPTNRMEKDYFLLLCFSGVVLFCVLSVFLKKLKPAQSHTLVLVAVLFAGFGIFTILFPAGMQTTFITNKDDVRKLIPVVTFLGLILLFRLMGRFESPS